MQRGFAWYELRTTDPSRARAFYEAVLGLSTHVTSGGAELSSRGVPFGEIGVLPARARALGAPPHWLVHLSTEDPERMAEDFAARLGPTRTTPGGHLVVGVRDPSGAVLALSSRAALPRDVGPRWHMLMALDPDAAFARYATRFGWRAQRDQGVPALRFGTTEGGAEGAVYDRTRHPEVHPQWLCAHEVVDLDAALAEARRRGGLVVDGSRHRVAGYEVVACEDPLGAAFGICAPTG